MKIPKSNTNFQSSLSSPGNEIVQGKTKGFILNSSLAVTDRNKRNSNISYNTNIDKIFASKDKNSLQKLKFLQFSERFASKSKKASKKIYFLI